MDCAVFSVPCRQFPANMAAAERSINLFFRAATVTVRAYAVHAAYPSNHWLIVLDVMRLSSKELFDLRSD